MASCGETYHHKMWQYGRNFCVECSIQALRIDPEGILEPLYAKIRQYSLRVLCSSRLLIALLEAAKPLTFPARLIPTIAESVEAVVSKLRTKEMRDACSALLTKCLEIVEDDPPQCPRVTVVTSVVSKSLVEAGRVERLLAVMPDQVVKLMCCPRIDRALRVEILSLLHKHIKIDQLLERLFDNLHSAKSSENAACLLDLLGTVLTHTASDLKMTQTLHSHIPRLLQRLSRCVMSRDPKLQLHAVIFLGCLANQRDPYISKTLISGDIADSLKDVIFSHDNTPIRELLNFLPLLCNNQYFYEANGRAKYFIQNIILKIGATNENEIEICFSGIKVLGLFLIYAVQFESDVVGSNADKLVDVLSSCMMSSNNDLSHIAAHTALHFIAARQISKVAWQTNVIQLAKLVLTKDTCPSEASALKLAENLLHWCDNEDKKLNVDLDTLIATTIVDHAKKCATMKNGLIDVRASRKLLVAVKKVLSCDKFGPKLDFCVKIASLGFLDLTLDGRYRSERESSESIGMALSLLCESHFDTRFEVNHCSESLTKFFLDEEALLSDAKAAEVILCHLYCRAFYNPQCDSARFVPHIIKFLSHCDCGSISSTMAKAVLFILASQGLSGILPECVIRLVCRWAVTPESIYTNNPLYVDWVLALQQRHIPQELLVSTLQLYLAENSCAEIACNATNAIIFMEVMVRSQSFEASSKAHQRLKHAILEERSFSLIEIIWMNLPIYLVRQSAQNSDGNYGHAYLLSLAAQNYPSEACAMPLDETWSVLPEYIVGLRESNATKWSIVSLESALEISMHILTSTRTDMSQRKKLKLFLKHHKFMTALEYYINLKDLTKNAHIPALKLLSAMIGLHSECLEKTNSPKIPCTIKIDPKILVNGLICENQSCSLTLAVLNVANSIIPLSPSLSCLAKIESESDRNLIMFSTDFYRSVHTVIALHLGTPIESAGWQCLRHLLNWNRDKWLCHSPWTHTLIWTADLPSKSADATRQMLTYLILFFSRLHESHKAMSAPSENLSGSESKMTNKTAQRLVCCASAMAYQQRCRREIHELLKLVLELGYELQEEVRVLIVSKLTELKFSG